MYEPYNRLVAVTIAQLLDGLPEGLQIVGGAAGADNQIRWVHVSELENPTPWLKGGELLLTTGMGLGASIPHQREYLERLVGAGLAGLGLGTGFSFSEVPASLRREADRLEFPVFDVPYDVPFIAITEAVFTQLNREQVEVLQRAIDTQMLLTQSVLREGMSGLVSGLARVLDGWAVVLDLHGLPIAAAPDSAGKRATHLWEQIRVSRPDSPRFSLSLVEQDQRVSAHPIGVVGHVDGVLVLGTRQALGQYEGIVASHAVSLLAIEFSRTASVASAQRTVRGDFLDALLGGVLPEAEVRSGLARFGFDPGEEIRVMALAGPVPLEERAWAVEDVLSRRTQAFLTGPRDDTLVVILPVAVDPGEVRAEASEKLSVPLTGGVGSAVSPLEAARGLREAMHSLRVSRLDGKPIADFASLGTYRLLLTLQDPDALRAFVEAVLEPLDGYDREQNGELISSLRAFLEHNARWEPAAAELGVHRHTLRYRMRKVEDLTGRSLEAARDRMELWLALQARELQEGVD